MRSQELSSAPRWYELYYLRLALTSSAILAAVIFVVDAVGSNVPSEEAVYVTQGESAASLQLLEINRQMDVPLAALRQPLASQVRATWNPDDRIAVVSSALEDLLSKVEYTNTGKPIHSHHPLDLFVEEQTEKSANELDKEKRQIIEAIDDFYSYMTTRRGMYFPVIPQSIQFSETGAYVSFLLFEDWNNPKAIIASTGNPTEPLYVLNTPSISWRNH